MKLAIGTVQFGLDYGISNSQGKVPEARVKEILEQAYSLGITTLDCAAAYGESEDRIGKIQNGLAFDIITKVPPLASDQISLTSYLDNSLAKLRQNNLHGLLFHSADDLITHPYKEKFYHQLQTLKNDGIIKKMGASIYFPEQLYKITDTFDIDIVQVPINIFDQRFLATDIINLCIAKKISFHARSVFLQGLIFIEEQNLPRYFSPFKDKLQSFQALANKLNCSKLTLALAILLQNNVHYRSLIEKVIIGVCNIEQLNEVVKAYQAAECLAVNNQSLSVLADDRQSFINPNLWPKKDTHD